MMMFPFIQRFVSVHSTYIVTGLGACIKLQALQTTGGTETLNPVTATETLCNISEVQ